MESVTRKIRSRRINGFYNIIQDVDDQPGMVTGQINITTDDGDDIVVFQAMIPISRTDFLTRFAALETALNETWFQIPVEIEYHL